MIALKSSASTLCASSCGPRQVYWPILRPSCGSNEEHKILGKLLNNEENVEKYLGYVQEYVNILTTGGIVEKLYAYGNDIKEYVVNDPFFSDLSATISAATGEDINAGDLYTLSELGRDTSDYNTDLSPFLKTFVVRLEEVQKQLDAINDGTLPR